MEKKNWIIAGLTAVGVGATAVALAVKVKNQRDEKNAKHLVVLSDEADQPLKALEDMIVSEANEVNEPELNETLVRGEEEPIIYHSVVDPLTRNEEIVREVARMEQEDDDQPLKSDDELMQETAKEGLRSDSKSTDVKVVSDLLSVYTYLDSAFVLKAIDMVEKYAHEHDQQLANVTISIQCNSVDMASRLTNIMAEFGYDASIVDTENTVEVKTSVMITYVKLLQDLLTIANQAYYVGAKVSGYEVVL